MGEEVQQTKSFGDHPPVILPTDKDYEEFDKRIEGWVALAFEKTGGVNDQHLADNFQLELEVAYSRMKDAGYEDLQIYESFEILARAFESGTGTNQLAV